MISIEVNENDIIRAMKNTRFNPVQIAVSRKLNTNPGDVDVGSDKIFVWSNDEDHKTYLVKDSEDFDSFMKEWEFYIEEDIDFVEPPFSFEMVEKIFKEYA